ncbi:MAG: type II secretion system F family protein [Actinomycetota bacterium]|nr:type II secretion system F family protein [Actinomycetota bacterium]
MTDLACRAETLRCLAGLLRAGLPIHEALCRWTIETPVATRPPLEALVRRTKLGLSPARAAEAMSEWDDDARALAAIFSLHSELGGDVATMLDAMAGSIEERDAWIEDARAAGAGARVSSRVVAGLPLAFLPVTPASGAPLFDPGGLVLIVGGVALAIVGMKWIGRLMPRPTDSEDTATAAAALLAGSIAGGASPSVALTVLTEQLSRPDLQRAKRLVSLGFAWSEAFARSQDPGLRSLATVLEAAESLGVPLADALQRFARRRRAQLARDFEMETKRASVLMMIPLTVCVLPAFVLLALGPFLRGLSLG